MVPNFPVDPVLTPDYTIWTLGKSVQNRPLDAVAIAPRAQKESIVQFAPRPSTPPNRSFGWVLFVAGVHGDEVEGVWLLEAMRSRWTRYFSYTRVGAIVWVQANPDGYKLGTRWNANQVDLNRNLPTKDWSPEAKNPRYPPGPMPGSEPETRALLDVIDLTEPIAILSAHSFEKFQINVNGPSLAWGQELAKLCQYPVTDNIGYPTPGSLGTYAGFERSIPTITLEIQRGIAQEMVESKFVPVLEATLQYWENQRP